METQLEEKPKVGLFVTCLVDLFRPSVGRCAIELIEEAGCDVEVPIAQTCCGMQALNNGDLAGTKEAAIQVLELFENHDYVVVLSDACASMIKKQYFGLFDEDDSYRARMKELAGKTHDLVYFLTNISPISQRKIELEGTVTVHDSCANSGYHQSNEASRNLLSLIKALELIEMKDSDVCCGFGGACSKSAKHSRSSIEDKTQNILKTGADMLITSDMGCLMGISAQLKREGSSIQAYHIAEVLAEKS